MFNSHVLRVISLIITEPVYAKPDKKMTKKGKFCSPLFAMNCRKFTLTLITFQQEFINWQFLNKVNSSDRFTVITDPISN